MRRGEIFSNGLWRLTTKTPPCTYTDGDTGETVGLVNLSRSPCVRVVCSGRLTLAPGCRFDFSSLKGAPFAQQSRKYPFPPDRAPPPPPILIADRTH